MGNTQNKEGDKPSLAKIIDFVATNYILTQNFQDMKKLSDMKYCNNLVILTSKVIENKLSDIEVEFLAQRLKQNEEINEMTTEKLKFMNKKDLADLDVKNQTQKRRMCIGIAKFYVKIAHIYAAIVTTIKPNYTYTEESSVKTEGSSITTGGAPDMPGPMPSMPSMPGPNMPVNQVGLEQKQTIPEGAKVSVKINNICSQRLNALLNGQDMSGENIVVKPNFCKMNLDISTNKSRTLASEPGIPELSKLYYDKYDFDQGGFTGMTPKMEKVYLADVQNFYKIFTGESSVPENIKTFSDIPLRAFHRSKGCIPGGDYLRDYKGTVKDKLFKTYADHIKKMMETTETNQNKLLAQIDKLFVFNVNPITKAREVTIMPNLTDIELQKIVTETRQIIIDLYIRCEQDFLTGLEIFEAIVEKQIMDTSVVQKGELQQLVDKKLASSDLGELTVGAEKKAPEPADTNPIVMPTVADVDTKAITEAKTNPEAKAIESSGLFSKFFNPISNMFKNKNVPDQPAVLVNQPPSAVLVNQPPPVPIEKIVIPEPGMPLKKSTLSV
jgi:hypothetical protein